MKSRMSKLGYVLCLLLWTASTARSADTKDWIKTVTPFVDEQVLSLVHVDLTSLELEPIQELIMKLVPEDVRSGMTGGFVVAKSVLANVKDAGVKDVYVVMPLGQDQASAPLVILPNAKQIKIDSLRPVVASIPQMASEIIGDAFVIGTQASLDRVKKVVSKLPPQLSEAMDSVKGATIQIVMVPSAELKRVAIATNPPLPKEIGGTTKDFLEPLQWGSLGVELSPMVKFQGNISTKDEAAAKQLKERLDAAVASIGKSPGAKAFFPDWDQLAKMLSADVNKGNLTWEFDGDELAKIVAAPVSAGVQSARSSARRVQSMNNLKQIGISMHVYHDVHGSLPASSTYDKDDKPLLSWRVHILPYIEEEQLYKQFHLDEPWDSEHNKALIPKMPKIFLSPASKVTEAGKTTYLAVVEKDSAFGKNKGLKFSAITDGLSNIILVVEANDDQAVTWTKPDDYFLDVEKPTEGLGKAFPEGFISLMGDGSVRFIANSIDKQMLIRLFNIHDGQVVTLD